ncbi:MAG TPA: hypothetical protein VHR40_04705 [Thermoleophilaceae bacterium]|jgi:uncharacterized protein involved in exopolysaccharide biosynthesis|nr:hypothetical protein [Thermoleophilaceae bacterium]
MDLVALSARLARRWWLVVGLAGIAALGAATADATKTDEGKTVIQFVLRPDASVTNDNLPGTLEALKSDGTVVQTVIGVMRNRAILRRAATDADVTLTPDYSADATVEPGSTLIDATLTGPDRAVLARLAAGYARESSLYVASSYSAYVLERLSTNPASASSGPGGGQIVVVALLFGGALGVLLVAAELRIEPQLRRLRAARRDGRAEESSPEAAAPPPPATPLIRPDSNGHSTRPPSWRRPWRAPSPSRAKDED